MPTEAPPDTLPVPPLQAGDKLARGEFERRYEAMPPGVKAERLNGIVYMSSPVRAESHGRPTGIVMTWLNVYAAATHGTRAYTDATIHLGPDNDVQPDGLLRVTEECGGTSRINADDYLEGPPELVCEVAASTASYDLHVKKEAFRQLGASEYLVWQIHENELSWFVLDDGAYVPLEPGAGGLLKSRVFPGLHLDVDALRERDLAAVLEAARRGAARDEHAAFTRRLERRAASS